MILYHVIKNDAQSTMNCSVKLAHITPNAEDLIVYQARPHNPNSKNPERLIRYLIDHKHWSPFQMATMGVQINTQRDIAAQILRHQSFSFQEFSQRYADASAIGYTMPELRLQDYKNRQNSFEASVPPEIYHEVKAYLDQGQQLYRSLIEKGYAKETCRRILPLCQNTRIFMTGSIRSWIHYLLVRTDPGTQKEHREVAEEIKKIFKTQLPIIYQAAFENNATTNQRLNLNQSNPVGAYWSSVRRYWRESLERLQMDWRFGNHGN